MCWAIDRERSFILTPTGGVPHEIMMGFGLYMEGEIINIEAIERVQGDEFDGDLKIQWEINKIEQFVMELHNQIEQMDFSVKEGTTIVGYSGFSNGKAAWEIAQEVSKIAGKRAIYISNLPAGTLIGEGLLSLDDFVSAKLMGETKGANSNLLYLCQKA